MGTATWVITDLETSVSVTLRLDDTGLPETDSPPPSTETTTLKRAIVIHPMPQLDYDVGQDQGLNAMPYQISGLCQKAIRDQLVAWINLPQFTTAHKAGRMRIVGTNSEGTVQTNVPIAAMESLVHSPKPGSPKWYKVTVGFMVVSSSQ